MKAYSIVPLALLAQLAKPTIVLVHGAFADASSWSQVIPILQREGYPVIAVQNPLASLAGDVETTKRVIDAACLRMRITCGCDSPSLASCSPEGELSRA